MYVGGSPAVVVEATKIEIEARRVPLVCDEECAVRPVDPEVVPLARSDLELFEFERPFLLRLGEDRPCLVGLYRAVGIRDCKTGGPVGIPIGFGGAGFRSLERVGRLGLLDREDKIFLWEVIPVT